MAEPLKAIYHEAFIQSLAQSIVAVYPSFDAAAFAEAVFGEGWDELELKERMRRITLSLGATLPSEYGEALEVLEAVSPSYGGLQHFVFPDFVEVYGLSQWERSIDALAKFTRQSTSEFAVRPFLLQDQERMLAQMSVWADDADEHVRRLASEGCRPRLPWAVALPRLKRDPEPIIPILEKLKADPSEYVRRSVANNLNDISKDHPERVVALAEAWIGRDAGTDWILKHGCRGLLRAAHPRVMALFGMAPPAGVTVDAWTVTPGEARIGDSVRFRYAVRAPQGEPVKLRIELAAYFVRTTGRDYRKLFKLSEKVVAGGSLQEGGRLFSYADLSTRRHYPGLHRLALVVNGQELASADVTLLPADRGEERSP
ncbi:DNA alkylation repair protein [Cohnella sp. GCM10027633]|uniref:DNA alkylation repair protein n=1 Tax=unclassified Cohnella TaxID=2636738 RepID=UPI0036276A47